MIVTGLTAAPASHATTTSYPGGTWDPGPPQYGVVATKNVMVPMSDGASLTVDVYYPADLVSGARASGTFPVLLTQTPYTGSLGATNLTSSTGPGALFVQHGYIFVSADVRGTGRSGGFGGFFAPRDAQDGVELVQWAAQLDGSNGDVGLQGCSYLGQTQLYTAAQLGANSPVKAMIPMCIGGDVYRDIYFDNGIPTPAWTGATCCAGTLLGPTMETFMAPKLAETQAGGDIAFYKQFWLDRDHVAQAQAIVDAGIPALMWNGWIDNGFGGLELYAALQNAYFGRDPLAPLRPGDSVTGRYQMIVGEWDHGGGIDPAIELQWYDTWIKGVDTGLNVDTTTPLHLWERQRGWVNAASYPMTDSYTALYLGGGGALASAPPSSSGSDALSWGPTALPGTSVSYTTDPIAAGTTIAGPGSVRVNVSTTGSNFELMADLFDVAPDGTALHVMHGGLLGSLGARDASRSWTDGNGVSMRPFLSLQGDTPVTPNATAQYEIPLQPAVWSIAPGHSIRLQLATQPDLQNCLDNLQAIEAPAVGCVPRAPQLAELAGTTTTVTLGGDQASLLTLPLLTFGAFPLANHGTTPTSRGQDLPLDW
jgi:predicted acyl esterase